MNLSKHSIGGKPCHIYNFGTGEDAVIVWGTYAFTGNEEKSLLVHLQNLPNDFNFTLLVYHVDDWNADFSPWEAADSEGQTVFTGKGRETLDWIEGKLIPYINKLFSGDIPIFLAGYSLAGLFSLWGLYESKLIRGAVCCSGSLWMDGWKEYMAEHEAPEDSYVYLSLGGKEEKTKDPKMASVGERFREQERRLKADPHVLASVLEWNKGGHFADAGKRLAKGIIWLLFAIN